MKRVILCLILVSIFNEKTISQNRKILVPNIERTISVSSFEQLVINGNFKLTLVENDKPSIQVKGSTAFVKAFKTRQYHNVLLVKSIYTDDNINNQVIVNVKNLKKLFIQDQSVISTEGILQSENLNILIAAECFIKIINNGITKISASENFDVETVRQLF